MQKTETSYKNNDIINKINEKIIEIVGKPNDCELFIPTFTTKKTSKKILVMSGGGIKGIAMIGALCALNELNVLQNITTFAGTSVGSLLLFLIIIGYFPSELHDFIKIFDLGKLKGCSISLLMGSYGLDSGEKIIKTIEGFMIKKKINTKITLKELFELTNKTFYITVVNITKRRVEYLSHLTNPNLEVVKAIRMSISIPFVFTPVEYDNCLYVDGGCIDNFPMICFDKQLDDVIGICAIDRNPQQNNITTIYDYGFNVIFSLINGITEISVRKYKDHVIEIILENVLPIDFDLSLERKNQLFEIGYKTVHEYMNKFIYQ